MTEVSTLVTDWLLGALAVALAVALLRGPGASLPARLWGWAFLAFAVAAFAGGAFHGFRLLFPEAVLVWLWKATIYAIGAFGTTAVCGSIVAATRGRARALLFGGMIAIAAVYAAFMATHDAFVYVVYFNVAAMVFLLALQLWTLWRRRDPASPWIVAGIAVSAGAAAVQVSGVRLSAHFNHNDLFHVIQMPGVWLLFHGARLMPEGPPEDAATRGRPAAR